MNVCFPNKLSVCFSGREPQQGHGRGLFGGCGPDALRRPFEGPPEHHQEVSHEGQREDGPGGGHFQGRREGWGHDSGRSHKIRKTTRRPEEMNSSGQMRKSVLIGWNVHMWCVVISRIDCHYERRASVYFKLEKKHRSDQVRFFSTHSVEYQHISSTEVNMADQCTLDTVTRHTCVRKYIDTRKRCVWEMGLAVLCNRNNVTFCLITITYL